MVSIRESHIALVGCVLVLVLSARETQGFLEQPLPKDTVEKYREEVRTNSLDTLVQTLRSDIHRQKKEAILDELSERADGASAAALTNYIHSLKEKVQALSTADPELRMLVAKGEVVMLKRAARQDQRGLVIDLEKLLDAEDTFVVDAACAEFSTIPRPLAVETLKRHEAKGKPVVKITRLNIEYGALPKDEFVSAVLNSAHITILESEGAVPLVAERSVLMQRDSVEGLGSLVLAEITKVSSREAASSVAERRYSAFLTSVYRDLPTVRQSRGEGPQSPLKQSDSVNRSEVRKSERTSSDSVSVVKNDTHAVSRPEDRGGDLSRLDKEELFRCLSQSADPIKLRKASKVLGDRSIDGTLSLSEQEKEAITNVVQRCLLQTMSKDAKERVEARHQIERLWWVAVPTLLRNVATGEPAVTETVIKSLVLMRNEEIVRSLIVTARTASNPDTRALAVFALGNMTENRESLIPGRTCMNAEKSNQMAETLIRPFLQEIAKTETNNAVLEAVSKAVKDLESAVDRRVIPEVRRQ